MFKNLKEGVRYFGKAFSMLFGTGLAVYLLYPLIISFLLYWTGFSIADTIISKIQIFVRDIDWLASIPWLAKVLSVFISIAIRVLFWVLQFVFQKYLVLLIMSPLLALLSERVEEMITGVKVPFNLMDFISDILRGVMIATRNFLLEMLLILAGFFVSFIPLIGLLFPVFSLLVSSYFYGFAMMDYSCERKRMNVRESVSFIWQNKYAAIGIGLVFYLLFIIPFLGFVVAPLVACIAATLSVLNLKGAQEGKV